MLFSAPLSPGLEVNILQERISISTCCLSFPFRKGLHTRLRIGGKKQKTQGGGERTFARKPKEKWQNLLRKIRRNENRALEDPEIVAEPI